MEDEKVRDYLVSATHPVGKFKAVFFGTLGYTRNNWRKLQHDLRALVASEPSKPGRSVATERNLIKPVDHSPKTQKRALLDAEF